VKTPLQKLGRAVELGFERMKVARDARYKFLAQYVGPFYSKSKGDANSDERKASPINLMYQAVTTMVPNLVYNDPRVTVQTEVLGYRQYADILGLACNHVLRKIHFRNTLRKTITDALFMAGFIKTGIAASDQTLDLDGKGYMLGEPFAERVDPDDMVIDPMARDWDEMSFVGNRFRMARADLLNSGLYDNDALAKLQSRYGSSGQTPNEASGLSGDKQVLNAYGEVAEYVDLVEVYVPDSGVIVTLPFGANSDYTKPLRVVEYEGPECGPYHMLGFAYVPDNVLPVAPASIWYWLNVMGNRIARKIGRQAERMKRVLAYDASAAEDVQNIIDADDGETIRVDNIEGIKEVGFGGTTDEAYEYMTWVEGQFSKQAANLDLLAGAAADQNTLGQSEILQNNGQVRLQDMQALVYAFTGDVVNDVAFFLHTDPLIDLPLTRRVGGEDQQVRYTPEMREGAWLDYNLTIRPFSMARVDPNTQARRVMEFISTGIPALAQAFQLLGPAFNIEGAVGLVMRQLGIDEADQIINSQQLQQQIALRVMLMAQGGVEPDGKAAQFPNVMPGVQPGGMPPQTPGGGRPQQPNPRQMGPTGGVSPAQEKNSQRQARSAPAQAEQRYGR
jgi:hypothetical protein